MRIRSPAFASEKRKFIRKHPPLPFKNKEALSKGLPPFLSVFDPHGNIAAARPIPPGTPSSFRGSQMKNAPLGGRVPRFVRNSG